MTDNAMLAPGSLVLIRHGRTEWSEAGRHTGRSDLPLTQAGEADIQAVAQRLHGLHPDLVLASPLQRARRTAELLDLGPVQTDDDLVEWDYGGYEGLCTAQIQEQRGDAWTVFEDGVVPGDTRGETVEEVAARTSRVLARIQPTLRDGVVVIVAHGHTLRVLAASYLRQAPRFGANLALDAGAICVLSTHHGAPTIERWNVPVDDITAAPTY